MLDNFAIFSDKQAITGTALSEPVNFLPFAPQSGEPILILARVIEDFNNCTSVTVEVQTSETEGGTYTTDTKARTILLADLKAGAELGLRFLPPVDKPWVKLKYTVAGTAPTQGKVFSAIVIAEEFPFKDGLYFSPKNPSGAASTA